MLAACRPVQYCFKFTPTTSNFVVPGCLESSRCFPARAMPSKISSSVGAYTNCAKLNCAAVLVSNCNKTASGLLPITTPNFLSGVYQFCPTANFLGLRKPAFCSDMAARKESIFQKSLVCVSAFSAFLRCKNASNSFSCVLERSKAVCLSNVPTFERKNPFCAFRKFSRRVASSSEQR